MKKLYRVTDPDKKKIAGICAGIGEIYNYDPNIVRIVSVFLCVLTQILPLVIAYLVAWYLIPEKSAEDSREEDNIA